MHQTRTYSNAASPVRIKRKGIKQVGSLPWQEKQLVKRSRKSRFSMNLFPSVTKKTANVLGAIFVLLSITGIFYLAFAGAEAQLIIGTFSKPDSRVGVVLCFVSLTLISQFLVIPSGSILMIGGGFLLGSLPATIIYTALLPVSGIIVGQIYSSSSLKCWLGTLLFKHQKSYRIITLLKNEPFTLSTVLRLTPVVPAAIAAIAAYSLNIRPTTFIFATLCVGWVRPLFFASIGGTAHSLSQIQDNSTLLAEKSIVPLLLLAMSVMLNLLVRCWLQWKRETSAN